MDRRTFHKLLGMGLIGGTRGLDSLSGIRVLADEVTNTQIEEGGPNSNEDRLGWFREAKFGMFLHWGLYSVLGGEWRGRQLALPTRSGQAPPLGDAVQTEQIMNIFRIPLAEYRQIGKQFNPVNFDAQQWVSVAKAAGMKYLVITAKHGDGFAMFHSKVSKYNIVDATPFGRDPLKELSEACQQQGIRFCVYYAHRGDCEDLNSYENTWDSHARKRHYAKYYEGKALLQVRELLTGYGPIGLIWFDSGAQTLEYAQQMLKLVNSIQPNCLVNSRLLVDSYFGRHWPELLGDYESLGDHQLPATGIQNYFEAPVTLNRCWGYSKFDRDWKSPQEVIHDLVNAVSKGGNYLLDIGPTGDGIFPQPAVDILEKVGAWTRTNGESIYGASANPFGELPWGRVTVKGEKIYLHVSKWPQDGVLLLVGLKNEVKTAYPLLDSGQSLNVRRDKSDLIIQLPGKPPEDPDYVIVLEIDGTPKVGVPVVEEVDLPVVEKEEAHSIVRLTPATAVTAGKAEKYYTRNGGFHISKWNCPQDSVTWQVRINHPHRYQVWVHYSFTADFAALQPQQQEETKYQVSVGPATFETTVVDTGASCYARGLPCEAGYEYRSFNIGIVDLSEPGQYKLTIRPVAAGPELMYLQWIELTSSLFENNPSAS